MRKAIVVALVLGLVVAGLTAPASAGKKKKRAKPRTVEARYENPTFGAFGAGLCLGCPSIPSGDGEFFAMVEITDDVSPTGHVDLSWDSDGDGFFDTGETICGATEEPISVPENTELVAFPWATPSADCAGSSLAGTIKVTFARTAEALTKK